ncbi:short chain dehydrogenase [Ceratobasidium sp. AG-Ba]|nr:short chain dehydrogenase [Ceratobasidium sp. AG-Ba]
MSTQPWKCALVTGGGGGLGKVFAQSLIKRGKTVYIAGRTESSLAKTAKEIGAAGYFVVDVGDLDSLPAFAEKVFKEAPEVDCLINNAGIQKPLSFTKGVDLKTIKQEIDINITGLVQLCALFVPHLLKKPHAAIMNVGSGLAYVPIPVVPVYCATKRLSRALRYPCANNFGPRMKANAPHSLSQEEWIAEVEKGWDAGKEEIGAGMSQMAIDKWRGAFGEMQKQFAGQSH